MNTKSRSILLLILLGCNSTPDKLPVKEEPSVQIKDSVVSIDTFYMDLDEISSNEYREYYRCPFEEFVFDPTIPKFAKDVYLDHDWDLSNDSIVFEVFDKLNTEDVRTRAFYFKVITKTKERADGYYAEGLGGFGKDFVVNNTPEFVGYFDNQECFTAYDLKTWVGIVMLEFSLEADNESENTFLDEYIQKLKINCRNCTANQKETLAKFTEMLHEEFTSYVKEMD
jgi:hypothetical protein